MEIKQDLKNDFAWTVYNRYRNHCDRENEDASFQGFANYLIRCGVIRERTIQRLMITELYPQGLASCGGKKSEVIALLSEQVGLSEKTIEGYIHNPQRLKLK
jgi:hypothetical protein